MSVSKFRTWRSARALAFLAVVAVLSGCSSLQGKSDEDVQGKPIDGAVRHSFNNEAVVGLWRSAEESRQDGDFIGAFRELRKALEIDPADPVVWSRLAEMALRLNKPEPSEKYAERSTQLANGNNTLIYRNWLIIQRAREINNDIEGADQALRKANQFRP